MVLLTNVGFYCDFMATHGAHRFQDHLTKFNFVKTTRKIMFDK